MKKLFFNMLVLVTLVFTHAHAEDYGLPTNIQDGNILHCFDWTFNDIKNELPNIAAAGFGAVQVSPVQGNAATNAEWYYAYMPYDFKFRANGNGSREQLRQLCAEADKYGIKIIVDVVANHVNQASGYHDSWWDSNGRVRWNGGIDYNNRYSITHNQLGEYGDVNSESSEVQQRAKEFIEDLKSLGVKGIRWDAAKHIALPSEGCNFWSVVTSVPGMWHYGEILDSPGGNANSLMQEYTKYISVTDNGYSNQCRNNNGVPGSYAGWAAGTIEDKYVVYWGESHDDYSNEWQASTHISQAQIDRAWAIGACRKGATALYFSRPSATSRNAIKMGQKGSLQFKQPQIAEVNKFRNAMVGRADYFVSSNGVACVTRQGGGAVIVKNGSGNISISNGGSYCPVGTYKDRVSGATFTVTASTISGNVGSTGIAVIYNDGTTPVDPDPVNPDPADPADPVDPVNPGDHYVWFDGTSFSQPQIWAWTDGGNCTSAAAWPGDNMTKSASGKWYWEVPSGKDIPTMIIIHEGDNKIGGGDLTYIDKATYHQDGSYTPASTPTPEPTPDPDPVVPTDGVYVYVSGLQAANIYVYNGSGEMTPWASAPAMTLDSSTGHLSYKLPDAYTTSNVIIKNGSEQYPGSNEPGLQVSGKSMLLVWSSKEWKEASNVVVPDPVDPIEPNDPDPIIPVPVTGSNLITDYYKVNPDGKVGSNKTIAISGHPASNALSHWTSSELIAQGVARDVAQAMKGKHERPIVDSYALYAAYDSQNLYIGVQYVYTVWDQYGEGKQPGESKPYNMDGRLMFGFDLDPNKSFDGYINGTKAIWNDENAPGAKFANGVDAVWIGSTKPGVGTPGFFIPTPDGHASYDAAYCKASTVSYGYQDGLLPSIDHIWGQKEFEFNPEVLTGNSGFADLKGEITESAHTFYEFKFPLSLLGITENYIKTQGIGIQCIDVYGSSPIGGTPYDPAFFDNVKSSYSMDSSSSKEKEDEDVLTYAPARIGRLGNLTGVEQVGIPDADAPAEYFNLQGFKVEGDNLAPGFYIKRQGSKSSKIYVK